MSASLPIAIFLYGADSSVREELAARLADSCRGKAMSYYTPVFDAMLGTFFQGDPAVQRIDDARELIPGKTYRLLSQGYVDFLERECGDEILANLLVIRADDLGQYYDTFVMADPRHAADIAPVATYFGHKHCLIVNLGATTPIVADTIENITIPVTHLDTMVSAIVNRASPDQQLGASSNDHHDHTSEATTPPVRRLDDDKRLS